MCISSNEVNKYEALNQYVTKNSVVVLGSTFMHDVPMDELKQSFKLRSIVYNRSLTDMKICEAVSVIESIMETMAPKKIVLQLGEVELSEGNNDIDKMIESMSVLVNMITSINKHCKVVLVSVCSDSELAGEYNAALDKLSKSLKCQYADIVSGSKKSDVSYVNAFMKLKFFLTDDVRDAFSFAI